MEIKEIQNLIKFVAKSGAQEVKLETDDFKITIKTNADTPTIQETHSTVQTIPSMVVSTPTQPQQVVVPPVAEDPAPAKAKNEVSEESTDNLITIKSPMIGTFYRKPSPDKKVFVEVGDTINEGDVLCVVEAMKLFNEIESEVSGKIVKILVDDSSPVEFDQPLFLVEPA
ncbi:MAG: acetyl-CoA carboxylase, biotin carboxyl carrier protein [Flavobacteriales bacterium MED-G15]|nr:MAG: acetyl-CoA carboxylase, biotin carboxyl carrier protein [Flavobacteriales bacterium MED-G15]|tara:strand:+ start:84 stop:593 length:510 start_codon:yes stop_codon:yes gene_type:complete